NFSSFFMTVQGGRFSSPARTFSLPINGVVTMATRRSVTNCHTCFQRLRPANRSGSPGLSKALCTQVGSGETGLSGVVAYQFSNKVNTGIRWNQALRGFNNATPGQDGRRNIVRYDSPTWEGLSFATAWGEDDLWDAAITFKKDIHDFAVVAKAGYGESTDPVATNCGGPTPNFECKWAGAAATIMHKPTGLYVYGGYGWQKINSLVPIGPLQPDETSTTWFIQPGIEHKWHPLGKTTIFSE